MQSTRTQLAAAWELTQSRLQEKLLSLFRKVDLLNLKGGGLWPSAFLGCARWTALGDASRSSFIFSPIDETIC